eukprot:CAMPEP_0175044406 /NCGR_PEP_ID=MMETSP0052_2-20121109/3783_1 /TAXON_ID=51329 ORGANISM="Polytomella parva, Strain SAG 63-3" /NCGR_SAMPLE_ID=MMETSP0052_2 /ASSEMBLY_ACC=CAM_ASM_000194 /LENGTH=436 /DNA_ID=CAMNT_0016307689 /DNA_START=261 /DNA_END=1571 /DNA_ORIENTATION=+
MSIATEAIRFRLHFVLQTVSLLIIPVLGYGLGSGLLHSALNTDLVNGIIIALCMPTTVASNVVFTSQAGGNEAVALINAVSGNILGIFISPAWLTTFIGISGKASYGTIVMDLVITVVIPFIIGQLVLRFRPKVVAWFKSRVNTGTVSNILILMLVWTTFCRAFSDHISVGVGSTICTYLLILSLYLTNTALCFLIATFRPVASFLRLDKKDVIAFTICASNKTLALGMPIIFDVFKNSPRAGAMSLPLLMYHVTQILFGSIFVRPMSLWIQNPSSFSEWPRRKEGKLLQGNEREKELEISDGAAVISNEMLINSNPSIINHQASDVTDKVGRRNQDEKNEGKDLNGLGSNSATDKTINSEIKNEASYGLEIHENRRLLGESRITLGHMSNSSQGTSSHPPSQIVYSIQDYELAVDGNVDGTECREGDTVALLARK